MSEENQIPTAVEPSTDAVQQLAGATQTHHAETEQAATTTEEHPVEQPAQGQAAPHTSKQEPKKGKKKANKSTKELPLQRFFHEHRKPPFAAGEIVAGKVVEVQSDAFVVDLFGKARAWVCFVEPHTPPAPEPQHKDSTANDADAATAQADATHAMDDSHAESIDHAVADPAHAVHETAETHEEHKEIHADDAKAAEAAILPAPEPLTPPDVGQIFRGRVGHVSESGHVIIVNRVIDRNAARSSIEAYRTLRRQIDGFVYGFNRGGFDVLVEGIRCFCPAALMLHREIEDPSTYVGRMMRFSLPASKGSEKNVILSRRSIAEREAREKAWTRASELKVGDVVQGAITHSRDFGVFVDIGGLEGLVHTSEISFAKNPHPSDAGATGSLVNVKVIQVEMPEKKGAFPKVSLSIKALLQDPWAKLEWLRVGAVRKGRVVKTTDFGAFVELNDLDASEPAVPSQDELQQETASSSTEASVVEAHEEPVATHSIHEASDGIVAAKTAQDTAQQAESPADTGRERISVQGLLHVSELGKNLKSAELAIKVGELVDVLIERVDKAHRKISLSKLSAADAKAIAEGTLTAATRTGPLKPGTYVTVAVERVEHHGIFVQVVGVPGKRGRAYLPNREMGTDKGTDHRKQFPVGTQLEVKIVGTDNDGGLKVSRRARTVDEERSAVQNYRKEASKQGFGTFGDLLKSKLNS